MTTYEENLIKVYELTLTAWNEAELAGDYDVASDLFIRIGRLRNSLGMR